ncbi:MAG TPA: hypothetical protein VGB28_06215 [Actinomycetota bacterium]|jgi:cell division protein FtsL
MAVAARRLEAAHPRIAVRRPARTRRRARSQGVPFGLFALIAVAAVIVGLVAAQAIVAQDSFRLAELGRTAARLEEDYGRLRLEAAKLSSPERIATAARKAGLVVPEDVQMVSLPPTPGRGMDDGAPDQGGALALKGVLGGAP